VYLGHLPSTDASSQPEGSSAVEFTHHDLLNQVLDDIYNPHWCMQPLRWTHCRETPTRPRSSTAPAGNNNFSVVFPRTATNDGAAAAVYIWRDGRVWGIVIRSDRTSNRWGHRFNGSLVQLLRTGWTASSIVLDRMNWTVYKYFEPV